MLHLLKDNNIRSTAVTAVSPCHGENYREFPFPSRGFTVIFTAATVIPQKFYRYCGNYRGYRSITEIPISYHSIWQLVLYIPASRSL